MLQFHKENHAIATLAVQSRQSSRQLLFNDQLQLSGRQGGTANPGCAVQTVPSIEPSHSLLPLAFSGIHIISPRILTMLTETGPFSIIDSYLRLSSQSQKILAFRHDHSYWRDLGKPADLAQAALDLQ
jgi:NDP-sugar pyrophosphorylase family protein